MSWVMSNEGLIKEYIRNEHRSLFENSDTSDDVDVPDIEHQVFNIDNRTKHIKRKLINITKNRSTNSSISFDFPLFENMSRPSLYDIAWLRSKKKPLIKKNAKSVRIVDLFCGCGSMSLGVLEACRALELKMDPVFAVDSNKVATATYLLNFPSADTYTGNIEDIIDSDIKQPLSQREKELKKKLGHIHLLIGGPPCQGNSNLNNRTRRKDPKNSLYLKMARFAEIVGPDHIFIENVPEVLLDKGEVVDKTVASLIDLGYHVQKGIIDMSKIGVPQWRKRFILIASRLELTSINELIAKFSYPYTHSLAWAIADLEYCHDNTVFDTPSNISLRNKERIDFLFQHNLYELPDQERPDCHRLKPHTYPSVYGRMNWNSVAPTITRGFGSPGQGRFIHPLQRRTITPHEAARIQFIPDFFDFGSANRSQLQEMIGNAVPPKLSYITSLEFITSLT